MAHWIIEDHGFGGQTYRCSDCRESWNDLFYNISREEHCPKCGAAIDEDATEYIEEKKQTDFARVYMNVPYEVRRYTEMENKLIQVSGFDVEKLIELFAAGWTLEPPKRESLHEMRIIK